jgi:hypothetical protein
MQGDLFTRTHKLKTARDEPKSTGSKFGFVLCCEYFSHSLSQSESDGTATSVYVLHRRDAPPYGRTCGVLARPLREQIGLVPTFMLAV